MLLEAELGRGAQTVAYRAVRGGVPYVVKVLHAARSAEALSAFRREAALLASVAHRGLPRIHHVGEVAGQPYLVMDLVEGRTLSAALDGGTLDVEQTRQLATDLATALAAVHRKGLVHRDVTPSNIVIGPDGHATLIDFGLAGRTTVTEKHLLIGTPRYLAPEQSGMLSLPVTGRSDLYSLGVVLFECLAGHPPFVGDDMAEVLRLHATTPPPDLRELAPVVPEELAGVIGRLLAKDPDDRYQSGEQLLADLRRPAATTHGEAGRTTVGPEPPAQPASPAARAPGERGPHLTWMTAERGSLAGRTVELSRLTRWWSSATAGTGAACVVRGGGGSGKSRLAEELATRAIDEGRLVLHAKAAAGTAVPLSALREAVEGHLAVCASLPPPQRDARHEEVRAAAGDLATLLAALSPALATVLGATAPQGDCQDRFAPAVAEFLVRLAARSDGLLLWLDDLQWLDHGSRHVLRLLAPRLSDVPLLLLGTARDDSESLAATEAVLDVLRPALRDTVTLGPLDEAGVAALVGAELSGIDAGSALNRVLLTRGNGNPFVTLEYLRAIVEAGLLCPSWDGWTLDESGLDALALPDDVLGLVLARVERLGSTARRVLQVAAVAGNSFDADLVAEACRGDRVATLTALVHACEHQLIVDGDAGRYVFIHDRVREAMLDQLDDAHCRALHQRIAAVLDDRLDGRGAPPDEDGVYAWADHHLRGEPQKAPDRAFTACVAAGTLALGAQSPALAAEFLERAAALGQPLDASFLLLLGTALHRQGRLEEAQGRLEEALAAEDDRLRRGEILVRLAEVHRAGWNVEGVGRAVDRGLRELGAGVPRNRFALVVTTLVGFLVGLFVGLTRIGAGRLTGERRTRAGLIASLHDSGGYRGTLMLRPDVLLMHNLRSVYWMNRLGHGRQFATNSIGLGFLTGVIGLWPVAEHCFRRGERAIAQLGGDPELTAASAFYRGITSYLGGRDDGGSLAAALTEHGRWMETGIFCDGVAAVAARHFTCGDMAGLLTWLRMGEQRLSTTGRDQITSLSSLWGVEDRMAGRAAAAAERLRDLRRRLRDHPGKGLQVNVTMATLHTLLEEGDFGDRFDETADEFAAYRLNPRLMIRPQRPVAILLAQGRLAQARATHGEDRRRRLDQARAAIGLLQKVASSDQILTMFLEIYRADLEILQGRPETALDRLGRLGWSRTEAPVISYESARVRARALALLGQNAESARQAREARAVAEEQGWDHRIRWIDKEFDGQFATNRSSNLSSSYLAPTTTLTVQRERQRLRALEQISIATARILDPEAVVRITLDELVRILNADRGFLFLTGTATGSPTEHRPTTERASISADRPTTHGGPRTDGEELLPYLGRDATGADLSELTGHSTSLVERVRASRQPIVVTGTEEGESLGAHSVVVHGLRSIMIAPLQLENRLLGVVYLDSQLARGIFTAEDAGILTAMTAHIAMALETARAAQFEVAVRAEQRRRQDAETLREATTELSGTLEPVEVLARLLTQSRRLLGCRTARLVLTHGGDLTVHRPGDEAGNAPDGSSGTGSGTDTGTGTGGSPVVDGATTTSVLQLIATGETVLDTRPLPSVLPDVPGVGWIAVPLVLDTAEPPTRGLLLLQADRPGEDLQSRAPIAAALAAHAATAHQRAVLFQEVRNLAVVDDLTGLANRRRFFEVAERDLASCRRGGRPLTVLMLDLDRFKQVNDTYGHQTGDEVLRELAQRLAAEIRSTDILGRYGGEEFALALPDSDAEAAAQAAERLRAAVDGAPFLTRSGALPITISIGLADLHPDDADLDALLARADQALYRAKRSGRNRWVSARDLP